MPKLTTATAVLGWAYGYGRERDPDSNYGETDPLDTATAAYIAECVRLRQTFDDEMDQMACADNPECKCRMSAVRASIAPRIPLPPSRHSQASPKLPRPAYRRSPKHMA